MTDTTCPDCGSAMTFSRLMSRPPIDRATCTGCKAVFEKEDASLPRTLGNAYKRIDCDEAVRPRPEDTFPNAEFKGQWDAGDDPKWETFSICLFGREAGDFLTEPDKVRKALELSGYRLTLTKVSP